MKYFNILIILIVVTFSSISCRSKTTIVKTSVNNTNTVFKDVGEGKKLIGDISYGDYYYETFRKNDTETQHQKNIEDEKEIKNSSFNHSEKNINANILKDNNNKDNQTETNFDNLQKFNHTEKEKQSNTNHYSSPNNSNYKINLGQTNNTGVESKSVLSDETQKSTHHPNSNNYNNSNKIKDQKNLYLPEKAITAIKIKKDIIRSNFNLEDMKSIHDGIRIIDTYRFTIKKRDRLKSFRTINCPGKDYHLVQNPLPGSQMYFFISDRLKAFPENKSEQNNKKILNTKKDTNKENIKNDEIGTGLLEILTADAKFENNSDKEIFSNPKFINYNKLHKGDKLGFALYYNSQIKKLELYYSASGTLCKAISSDGKNFYDDKILHTINSKSNDRDPSISPDGKILVFASSRKLRSSRSGVELFVCIRNEITKEFSDPIYVKDTFNSFNELFPSIYQSSLGTFVFFMNYKKNQNIYSNHLYSVEIKEKKIFPIVKFSKDSDIPYKYITVSYANDKGLRIMSSYPVNGYDIFRMDLVKYQKVKLKIDKFGKVIENN